MKAIIGKTALGVFLAAMFAGQVVSAAEQKIATVDLKKIFEGYFKTKLVNATLEDEVSGLRKDSKALVEDYQKAVDEYKKSNEEANNQALSFDEREKRKKESEGKLIRVNDAKQSLEQFERTATSNLEEKQRIAKEKILTDILNVITNQAKVAGYTQVIDTAAEGLSKTRILLFDSGQHDITEAILKELNANAPANLPTTSPEKKGKDK
jgi:Skp family chaperone for outer membrane proteins